MKLMLYKYANIRNHIEIFDADDLPNLAAALKSFNFYLYKVEGGKPYERTGKNFHILSDKTLQLNEIKELLCDVIGAKQDSDVQIEVIKPEHRDCPDCEK